MFALSSWEAGTCQQAPQVSGLQVITHLIRCRVVRVVLILPPCDTEPLFHARGNVKRRVFEGVAHNCISHLAQVAKEEPGGVVHGTVGKDLWRRTPSPC